MSRGRGLLRPMAPDLARLGDQLQEAVDRDVRRARARRQAFLNGAASMLVVIPVAVTIALGTTAGEEQVVGAGGASTTLTFSAGNDISWRHIPEKPVQTLEYMRCLDAKDCPAHQEPVPFLIDFPPRRA